jgi:hypothetical protein
MGNIAAVSAILTGVEVYLAIGALVAIAFLVRGAARVDDSVKGAGIFFRLLILPGLIALWPLILLRWLVGGQPHAGGK